MKLSVVISTYNRLKILDYVLRSMVYQTFPRNEQELIFVDDGSTADILGLLKWWKPWLACKIQYIRIDKKKSEIPVYGHTPALTNNVGFKHATGEVILIQGNDVMHLCRDNFKYGYDWAMRDRSVFATVWECNKSFMQWLEKDKGWKKMRYDLMPLYNIPGAKSNNVHMTNWYWYILFVKRKWVMRIQGVDEEYLRGVCAEDDNFAYRLGMVGTSHFRDRRICGLHLWHYDESAYEPKQRRWGDERWEAGARINRARWRDFKQNPHMVANHGRDWGSDKVIVQKEVL